MSRPQRDRLRDIASSGLAPCKLADPCAEPRWHDERNELTAAGFDDFRQLAVSGSADDPIAMPARTGLRVPPKAVGQAYRFLLAAADLDVGDTLVGLRQGLEIGAMIGNVGDGGAILPPIYPLVRPVVTYNFRFVDGAQIWTLTSEPLAPFVRQPGPWDQDSFVFRDAGSSALVYATASFPALPLLPGYLGLSAYTPPAMLGTKVIVARDIRWPFDESQSNQELWQPVDRPTRYRLYCDVLQTNPLTRNSPNLGGGTDVRQVTGLTPETEFVQYVQSLSNVQMLPVVWAVHGRLVWNRRRRTR
jgi:hypothetical protein